MLDLTLLSRRGSCKCHLRWDCKWDSHRDPGQKLLKSSKETLKTNFFLSHRLLQLHNLI